LLQLIAEGYTLPQLADKMYLGINTIRSYRQKLNIKLNAHNTVQLLQNAKVLKLLPESWVNGLRKAEKRR
jgi:DNA-binding CsgD family transcriptional regulator